MLKPATAWLPGSMKMCHLDQKTFGRTSTYTNIPNIHLTAKPNHRICRPSHSGIAQQKSVTQPALHRTHQSHESRFNAGLRAVERTTSIVGTDDIVRPAVLSPVLKESFVYHTIHTISISFLTKAR
jgi:hypothetical protein